MERNAAHVNQRRTPSGDACQAMESREAQYLKDETIGLRAEAAMRHAGEQQASRPGVDPGQTVDPKAEDIGRNAEDRFVSGSGLAERIEACERRIREVEEARKRDREQMESLRGQVLNNNRKEAWREKGEA